MPFDPFSGNTNQNESQNNTSQQTSNFDRSYAQAELEYLKNIDATLNELLKTARSSSQSDARQSFQSRDDFRRRASSRSSFKNTSGRGSAFDEFTDAFEEELMRGFFGSDFRDKIQKSMNEFADSVGVSLEDVPKTLGEELGKQAMSAFKDSKLGSKLTEQVNSYTSNLGSKIKSAYSQGQQNYWKNSRSTSSTAVSTARTPSGSSLNSSIGSFAGDMADDIGKATTAGASAGSALSGLANVAKTVGPQLLAGGAAILALDAATDVAIKALQWTFTPALEGAANVVKAVGYVFNRENETRKKNVELAQKRLEADIESMITEPFDILKESAQEVYDAWDKNIRLINGTQGYTKSDLQDLLASFSQRLRNEGLSSVVSSVDITESLAKVLESGLSGKAAEEFAYQATILNAAIPNQDFFGYADTYASIAANAMQAGKDQASALEYANSQLQSFANNVLYASRNLSGGFTTGLQDAQKLFEQSVQIAQASGTNNATEISSVMTAVASVVGSVAPDLASAMTDVIYQAATGGNASELVALRSLAGINASNTEFLKQLASDPQSVFETLFRNLANMQNMSEENYMEVAEGLSSIFGVSMDAFARVDFNYLADQIADMNANSTSLQENLSLLASGETTTSAEQLRMQQINEYLIDEGLAYVMDNEVARAIQQHMWDEQLAREMQETTYGVEITGAALSFLEGIKGTIDNLLTLLNPFQLTDKLMSISATAGETMAMEEDIQKVLEAGKVGTGNRRDLNNLLTRNADLNLTDSIVTLLGGGSSSYRQQSGLTNFLNTQMIFRPDLITDAIGSAVVETISDGLKSSRVFSPNSVYSWGTTGKSSATFLSSTAPGFGSNVGTDVGNVSESAAEAAKAATQAKIDRMLDEDYMMKFIEEGKTYEDWAETSKNFGIANLSDALEDVGYSEESVRNRFQSGQANYAAAQQATRYERENTFWDNTENYQKTINDSTLELVELQTSANELLENVYAKETQFYDAWVDYFVKHTAYSAAYDHTEVSKIQNAEKGQSQDAVYALAEALTKNSVDLLDPAVQTNALLSQILVVVNAIMQQNNEAKTGTSLPDTLQALALGLVKS